MTGLLALAGCLQPDLSKDEVEILSEKISPDGEFVASSFYCEGGGAAGYAYWNASLRKAGDRLNQRDGLLGKHKTWKGFTQIEVRWIDDESLEVAYIEDTQPAYREHCSVRVESKLGIKIQYVKKN
ncbi:MAG: hypothetical protein AAF492_24535 [Verrucomicrobiota bacterium]